MSTFNTARRQKSFTKKVPVSAAKSRSVGGLPVTVSLEALLDQGSDKRFRTVVYDLLTISSRMDAVRTHLGGRLGISGPQYSVVVAVAQLQDATGVSVGNVAQALHVSSAFVASETGKLVRLGFLTKQPSHLDRRSVLIRLTARAHSQIEALSPEIRAINDIFFGALNRTSFDALVRAAAALVKSSRKALQHLAMIEQELGWELEAAE